MKNIERAFSASNSLNSKLENTGRGQSRLCQSQRSHLDKIAVLIPCYNEAKMITKVITDWKKELPEAKIEYYGAAEPSVRCGESHLSGLTEPPIDSYSA